MSLPTKSFGSVCHLVNGKAFKPSDWSRAGIPIIRIQNLNGSDKPFNFWAGALKEQVRVKAGELLLAWSGTPGTSFGAHIWNGPDGVLNQHIFRCDLDQNAITKEWAKIAVNHRLHRLIEQAHGGVGLQHVTRGMVEDLQIPLPPLPEQRRIAEVLDRAEALRAKRRAALTQLDFLTQSLFLEMFGDPATNPKGWPRVRLGELITKGPQNGLYKPSSDYGSGVPILRIDAFYSGQVTKLDSLKRVRISNGECDLYGLRVGEIVINRVNSMEYLGKSALIPDLREPTVFESNMMRFDIDRTNVEPVYILQFLQTNFIKRQILTASKNAVNQSSINQQDVKSFQINVPPFPLQQEFARRVQAVEKLKTVQRASLAALDTLFASLQHRAFRGEV